MHAQLVEFLRCWSRIAYWTNRAKRGSRLLVPSYVVGGRLCLAGLITFQNQRLCTLQISSSGDSDLKVTSAKVAYL